jgi:glycosyltransferase involved in cell wall biosynthesis
MKVALVCDWFHPRIGGIELHLHDLARNLRARGHGVVVITSTPGETRVDGIRVRRIEGARAPRFDFLISPLGIRAVGDAIVEEGVDVAHCHVSIVSPVALGGALEAKRRGVPAAVTFHSVVPQTPLLARLVNLSLRTSRWPVCYSAVSERVAREVRPAAGQRPVSLLANGIDSTFWRVDHVAARDDVLRAITVMRLNPKKRPMALVGIMRRLVGLLPRRTIHLNVIGDGPERVRLQRAIERAKLDDHITLLGRQNRDEIRAHLAASDVFILPTIRESFGLAALEARCAGVPIVAMRASGVSEFIGHGQNGLLANSDEDIAHLVAHLAIDKKRRLAIATHNRTTTPSFDWSTVIDRHIALYREAIALRAKV